MMLDCSRFANLLALLRRHSYELCVEFSFSVFEYRFVVVVVAVGKEPIRIEYIHNTAKNQKKGELIKSS